MNYADLKLYIVNSMVMALSLSSIEVVLKIVLLLTTIGYTAFKWYSTAKSVKNEDK